MRRQFTLCVGRAVVHRAVSSSSSAVQSSSAAVSVRRRIRPPYYRKALEAPQPRNKFQEEFPNAGDANGSGPRLFDYQQMGDIVRSLPTIAEKIDFVNPYERPWTRPEKVWHRDFHPRLMAPRRAWNVPPIPRYFDSLNFYKYITKMRVVKGLDCWYEGLVPPTTSFETRTKESLLCKKSLDEKERSLHLLRSMLEDAFLSLSRNVVHLRESRVAYTTRCESFWIRSGFLSMYQDKEVDEKEPTVKRFKRPKFPCDDRRLLGELSFVLRDDLAGHVRSTIPLEPLFPLTDEKEVSAALFSEDIDVQKDVIFSPKVFNMWPDGEPLWQCPGFEPDSGDKHKFGRVAFKDISELNKLCNYWKVHGEEELLVKEECMAATAVISLFSWLNGQAHSLGYTQYNDIERPLVSQLVLSDGRHFFFAIAQLNTIAINIDVDGFVNHRSNVCYVEGPLRLYDSFDSDSQRFYHLNGEEEVEGLNPKVLSRILQMFIKD